MKRTTISLAALLPLAALLSSCDKTNEEAEPATTEVSPETNVESSDDYVFDSTVTTITLNGTSITVSGSGVTVAGSVATITAPGTYSVSGSLTNGQLIVSADVADKVKIQLNGASITSATSAPLQVTTADKVILYLVPGTTNSLTDGSASNADGALYSAAKLSLFGTGTLTVTGNADGGIVSSGGLIIKEGTYAITAAESTIKSDKNIIIDGGTFALAAGNDGVHGEESLTFNGGDVTISKSEEGIESAEITINDGTHIQLTSTDDGVNASSGDDTSENHFYMKGGFVAINAGGDGVDSNGYIDMTGGTIVVNGPSTNGNAAIDYDRTFTISGGLLVAVGSAGMAQAPSTSSTQNSVKVTFSSAKQANQLLHVQDASGTNVVTFSPTKAYQAVVISSPKLVQGSAYTLYLGGSSTGTADNGLYENGTYTAGTQSNSFTVSGSVTTLTAN